MPGEPLVDRCVAPFVRDPGLWPVTFVLLAHAVLGIAVALVEVSRSPRGFGLAALALVGAGSVACIARDAVRRRLGLASRALALSWALGALAAWGLARTGLY
jgi:hypothetical protein